MGSKCGPGGLGIRAGPWVSRTGRLPVMVASVLESDQDCVSSRTSLSCTGGGGAQLRSSRAPSAAWAYLGGGVHYLWPSQDSSRTGHCGECLSLRLQSHLCPSTRCPLPSWGRGQTGCARSRAAALGPATPGLRPMGTDGRALSKVKATDSTRCAHQKGHSAQVATRKGNAAQPGGQAPGWAQRRPRSGWKSRGVRCANEGRF